jgi:purine-cytosine permease-like protein
VIDTIFALALAFRLIGWVAVGGLLAGAFSAMIRQDHDATMRRAVLAIAVSCVVG